MNEQEKPDAKSSEWLSADERRVITLEEVLGELPELSEGPPLSNEEVLVSTPYSDVESWLIMLIGQALQGESRLMGPPGLREEVERQFASPKADEMTTWFFERTRPAGTTLDSWIAGFMTPPQS